MGKGGSKRKERGGPERAGAPKSLLELAWRQYQAGDVLLARRTARRLLGTAPTAADEQAAREIGRELVAAPAKGATASAPGAHELARMIEERTAPPPKAYLFALMAAAVIAVMIALAVLRS